MQTKIQNRLRTDGFRKGIRRCTPRNPRRTCLPKSAHRALECLVPIGVDPQLSLSKERPHSLMRTDGKAEIQHYVPQVLLRLHASDPSAKKGSEQIWCFDKHTDKMFPANIRGVLAGTRFYEIEANGQSLSLEEPLSDIEGRLG